MSVMKDTTGLKAYAPAGQAQLGDDAQYLRNELAKIKDAITGLIQAAQALEKRIVAGNL